MNKITIAMMAAAMTLATNANAQTNATDSVQSHANGSRLTIGGYGEAAYSRMFYSDAGKRYSNASAYKNAPDHGRFDIPHAVIYLNYDFGKGWTMGTEIEFEHGGTGSTIEYEAEEAIEYENETEKGGEVELEQFWIQKSFGRALNIRAGHIVLPVGLTNAYHEPLNFFTVYRPEGENTILPCTWHQTGVSLWGRSGDFRYEAQFVAGLNAFKFSRTNWIQGGAHSPYEFEVANKYGVVARIDNYTIPGLRIGLSGYYGQAMGNTTPNDTKYTYKGNVYVGAFDFCYNAHNWIIRGNADYGYVSDANTITALVYPGTSLVKPNESGSGKYFGSHAIATMVEVGYDVFSQIHKLRQSGQKLYVFGHGEYYDSSIHNTTAQWTNKKILAGGINYYPIPQICVKAEYNHRFFRSKYNDEPSLNIGVAYQGFFDTNPFKKKGGCCSKQAGLSDEQQTELKKLSREVEELKNRKPIVINNEGKTVEQTYVVNFAVAESELSASAKSVLNSIEKGSTVVINAFASPEGNAEQNQQLSADRANAVKSYLEGRGVNVKQTYSNGAADKYSNRIAVVSVIE